MALNSSLVATTGIIDPVLSGIKLLIYLLVKAAVFWTRVVVFRVNRKNDLQPA